MGPVVWNWEPAAAVWVAGHRKEPGLGRLLECTACTEWHFLTANSSDMFLDSAVESRLKLEGESFPLCLSANLCKSSWDLGSLNPKVTFVSSSYRGCLGSSVQFWASGCQKR